MMSLSGFFAEGGPVMLLIVLVGVAGLAAGVVQLVLAKSINLTGVVAGLIALTLVVGFLGSAVGWITVFRVIAMVDPDEKLAIGMKGFSEALTPTIHATVWVLLQLLVASVALTFRANAKP